MTHQGKIVVCCQGLIGGWEKRINGHWDLNPGLGSGPKSALPQTFTFRTTVQSHKRKLFTFFSLLRLFSPGSTTAYFFPEFLGLIVSFPRQLFHDSFLLPASFHAAHQLSQLFPSLASFTRATTRASKSNLTVQLQRATTSADRHATRLPPHQPPFTQERLASTSAPARDLQVGWGGNKARGGGNKARGRSTSTAQHQHILLWQL